MFGLGFFEILVILVVILLVVGPDKLPQFAQTLGRTMWQLRRAADEFKGEFHSAGINFDAQSIRREVNELKNLMLQDPQRPDRQIIQPPQSLPPVPDAVPVPFTPPAPDESNQSAPEQAVTMQQQQNEGTQESAQGENMDHAPNKTEHDPTNSESAQLKVVQE